MHNSNSIQIQFQSDLHKRQGALFVGVGALLQTMI